MEEIKLHEKCPGCDIPDDVEDDRNPIKLRVPSFNPNGTFIPHWHEHTEFHYIEKGHMKLRCGAKIIDVAENDCAVINSYELHEGFDGKCDDYCIILPPEFFENNHIIFKNYIRDDKVIEYFKKIFKIQEEKDPAYIFELKGLLYNLTTYLINNYSESFISENSYRKNLKKLKKINKAVSYVDENYAENITTLSLANMVYLSESHFCHLFKETMGKSAKEYLLEVRIKKAASIISGTDISISDAAFMCGFTDANYFSRAFKKITGKKPSELRDAKKYNLK